MTNQIDMFPVAEAAIGHNRGPELEDLPEEWTRDLRTHTNVLVEQAAAAYVNDEASLQQCVLLAGLIRDHIKLIDKEREETKAPYLAKCREIDNRYKDIEALLVLRDSKHRAISGPLVEVVGRVDNWRREQERIQQEEQRRIEAELERKREEQRQAEQARLAEERRLAEQARKQNEAIDAEARAAREQAEREEAQRQIEINRLERQATAAAAPKPIRNVYGVSAHRRPVYRVQITDLTAAMRHARKLNPTALEAVVKQIYEAQVRAGVRDLPGATVTADSSTVIRTR